MQATPTAKRDLTTSGRTRHLLFLHHSTGADILRDGDLRQLLRERAPAVELWDYAYNPPSMKLRLRGLVRRPRLMPDHYYGLRDGAGKRVPTSFAIPGDNTDPDGWGAIFAQPVVEPPRNAFSRMLGFDLVAFKPCFTILPIRSDAQLEAYRQHYRAVRVAMDRHPDKLFLPLTPPPLRAGLCSAEEAARARGLARWMMSPDFTGDRPNVAPFDLFDALAVPEGEPSANTLRPEYCREDTRDSHPNPAANRAVAAELAQYFAEAVARAATSQAAAAR